MPLKYRNPSTAFSVGITPMPPIFLEDRYIIEFRDEVSNQGGHITFKRVNPDLMTVAFSNLSPGVEPHKAVADPVLAENILAIVMYTIAWLKALRPITYPTGFEAAKPLNFSGLPALEKLAEQLKAELL